MPASAPTCKGFILAHQVAKADVSGQAENVDVSSPVTELDPYAVVPCPHPPTVPKHLSERCQEHQGRRSCAKAAYCEIHHCGQCKKVERSENFEEAQQGK